MLRGLEPEATEAEIAAAALQYVRKVGGVQAVSARNGDAVQKAVWRIARATADLLADLPPRQRPPATLPPMRRPPRRPATPIG